MINLQDGDAMYDVEINAILPAHNELESIFASIASIKKYVNKIIVACDNCSDDSYEKAIGAVTIQSRKIKLNILQKFICG